MGHWRPMHLSVPGIDRPVFNGIEYVPDEGEDMQKTREDMQRAADFIRYIHRVNAGLEPKED
jgi:hypothetical protein